MIGADPTETPRLAPVPKEGWTQQIREAFAIMEGPQCLENGTRFNSQAIMANHPELMAAWAHYNHMLVREGDLPADLREIAILRTAWQRKAGYEWYQHRILARRIGMSEAQLEAISGPADADIWSVTEQLVIRCADEFCTRDEVSAETIAAVQDTLGKRQLMELLWLIGSYAMLGHIFNSLRIPIEDFCIS